MRINYEFGDLEAFLAVKETGSFGLAAQKLNLSQSAITRRIKKLETALDTTLFERSTRAVKPTLAAKRLQARAESIIDNAQETAMAMRDESVAFGYQKNAIITIAILPSIAARLLPNALRLFKEAGHHARVRIIDKTVNEVAEAVAQGDADFGICSVPMLEPSTVFELLFVDQIVVALHRENALAKKDQISIEDLISQNLIVPTRGTGNRLLIDEAMAHHRQPIFWTYEVGRSTTALDLVAAGAGVALVPQFSASSEMWEPIVFRPIQNLKIDRPLGLISKAGHSANPAITALKQILRNQAQDWGSLQSN
ncbi:MAG: LysR family transcriptional regulator [Pikeienuella sp.]